MIIKPYYVAIFENEIELYKNTIEILYKLKCRNIKFKFTDTFNIDSFKINTLLIDLNVYKLEIADETDKGVCLGDIIENTNVTQLVFNDNEYIDVDNKLLSHIQNRCISVKTSCCKYEVYDAVSKSKIIKYFKFESSDLEIIVPIDNIKLLIGHPTLEHIQLWDKYIFQGDFNNKEYIKLPSQFIKQNNKCHTLIFGLEYYSNLRYSDKIDKCFMDHINNITINIAFVFKKNYRIINYSITTLPNNVASDRIKKYLFRNKTIGIRYLLLAMNKQLIPQIPKYLIMKNIYCRYINPECKGHLPVIQCDI
jgi:hypothetical protein